MQLLFSNFSRPRSIHLVARTYRDLFPLPHGFLVASSLRYSTTSQAIRYQWTSCELHDVVPQLSYRVEGAATIVSAHLIFLSLNGYLHCVFFARFARRPARKSASQGAAQDSNWCFVP
ncbi:hypothetical protein B0H19DRAFT_1269019 [Mycena capillaripes]|nr:hypothetical protein B0H19DRAFT_1269019 [Mycena capillaripes]